MIIQPTIKANTSNNRDVYFALAATKRSDLEPHAAGLAENGERYRIQQRDVRSNGARLELWVLTAYRQTSD